MRNIPFPVAFLCTAFALISCNPTPTLIPAYHTPLPRTALPVQTEPVSPMPVPTESAEPAATPSPGIALPLVPAPLAAGGAHTCMLTAAGAIRCWGNNRYGQLGNGTTGNASLPVEAGAVSDGAAAVAAGNDHTCALDGRGVVYCWGSNAGGQLGDGTTTDRSAPVPVAGLEGRMVMIAAGASFTCALTESGGVWCWGGNRSGQLGDGTYADRSLPAPVQGLAEAAVWIAAGQEHVCALLLSGGVKCWGRGREGQLGNGQDLDGSAPVDVVGMQTGAVRIAAGGTLSCAIGPSDKVWCWGTDYIFESGHYSNAPVEMREITAKPVSIRIGGTFACVVVEGGSVQCRGRNEVGQLGDGTGIDSPDRPVAVGELSDGAAHLAAGSMHACAILTSGGIRCWGGNGSWQLGSKSHRWAFSPIDVDPEQIHYYYSGIEAAAPPAQYPRKYKSIWDLTDGFQDLPAPGVNTYAVTVQRGGVWRWDFYQCAADADGLEKLLSAVKVSFLIDYQTVSEKAVLIFRSNYDSWVCQGWTTSLSQWELAEYELGILYEYTESVTDGEKSYPAGEYWQILMLKVED